MTPNHLTAIMNLFLALPVLLFFPGFVFSRTVFLLPEGMALCERLFARVLMSLIASSLMGIALAAFAIFDPQNLIFGLIVSSLICFLFKRFKFFRGFLSLRLCLEDVFAISVLFIGLIFFLWPSENIGSAFSLGRYLSRTGSLTEYRGIAEWTFILKGPLISVWYALIDGFFGIKAGLLTAPVFSSISLLCLFFLAKQWSSDSAAGVMTAALYVSNFTAVWIGRLPEGLTLCQLMLLGAVYFGKISWEEKKPIFLVLSTASLFLAFSAWPESLPNLIVMILGFIYLFFSMLGSNTKNDSSVAGFMPVSLPENMLKLLGFLFLGFWIFTYFQNFEFMRWIVPTLYGLLASLGLIARVLNTSVIPELAVWIGFLVSPWVFYKHDTDSADLASKAMLLFLPATACLSGCFLSYLSRFNRWTRWLVLSSVLLGAALPVYWERSTFFAKDYDGTIDFYDKLKKNFLRNDLLFSQDVELAAFLWNLFDLKVYVIPESGLDQSFQDEIKNWLKDGGKAFVLSRNKEPIMSGFTLRLQSVERLRTMAWENPVLHFRQRQPHQILVQLYEAVPDSDDLKQIQGRIPN